VNLTSRYLTSASATDARAPVTEIVPTCTCARSATTAPYAGGPVGASVGSLGAALDEAAEALDEPGAGAGRADRSEVHAESPGTSTKEATSTARLVP